MQGRILIVDGTASNRIIYKVKLSDAFYRPLLAGDGDSGLRMARDEHPDLILLNLTLPDRPGAEVLAALRSDPVTRSIPVIALAQAGDDAARQGAYRAGADEVMSKPVHDSVLLARMRNLLRLRGEAGLVASAWGEGAPSVLGLAEPAQVFEPAGEIALIAARPEVAEAWKQRLERRMRDRLTVLTRAQALALSPGQGRPLPEVFVIEAGIDGAGGGLRLMSQLGSHAGTRHGSFCIVVPDDDPAVAAMAFDLGADDVIGSDALERELELRLRTLMRRKREADRLRATLEDGLRLAMVDPLTGAYNRRYALPRLAGIAAQAAGEGSDFAVMVVDLDRFKSVNDGYGHAAGDAVLVEVARRLSENLRMTDLLARIGGEEFLVVLPQTTTDEARRVAERLRAVVAERPIALPSGGELPVTVSIGVGVAEGGTTQPEEVSDLVERADSALLRSKSAGRNVVTFCRSAA